MTAHSAEHGRAHIVYRAAYRLISKVIIALARH